MREKDKGSTKALVYQFTCANVQRACISSSTLGYDSGVVLRLSFGKGMPQTQNQCTSLVGASMGSNPIRPNFYGPSFKVDFQSHTFLQST